MPIALFARTHFEVRGSWPDSCSKGEEKPGNDRFGERRGAMDSHHLGGDRV